jgi:hypothetical protein
LPILFCRTLAKISENRQKLAKLDSFYNIDPGSFLTSTSKHRLPDFRRRTCTSVAAILWLSFGRSNCISAGLPEGLFSDQKSQFGYFLEALGIENLDIYSGQVRIFYDHWVYILVIW